MIERIKKIKNLKSFSQRGFSLLEMMVVLLIVALVAAATTPMVTKKMARNAGTGDSPWVFTGLSNDISFPIANGKVLIGTTNYNANGSNINNPRLVIAGGDGLAFADNNGNYTSTLQIGDSIQINDTQVGNETVAIGLNQSSRGASARSILLGYGIASGANSTNEVSIGASSQTNGTNAVAIGRDARAMDNNTIAIGAHDASITFGSLPKSFPAGAQGSGAICLGASARASKQAVAIGASSVAFAENSITIGAGSQSTCVRGTAIGHGAKAFGNDSIAVGYNAKAKGNNSVAIGDGAVADKENSIAIGNGVHAGAKNQIVIGTKEDTVVIPGNLVVGRYVRLSDEKGYFPMIRRSYQNAQTDLISISSSGGHLRGDGPLMGYSYTTGEWSSSDRRLKNVGKEFAGGLEELKKLQFFHYTFKKDEAKIPHVGVMAQDLQKVFPDAVTKAEDGYLRIRMEDMFYATINAIKELDAKISSLVTDVKKNIEEIASIKTQQAEQQKTIENQQKIIEELQKQNADLIKRIEKLEKAK